MGIARLIHEFLEILFPFYCESCGEEGHGWCPTAPPPWPTCLRCSHPHHASRTKTCQQSLPVFTLGSYADSALRNAIRAYKYGGQWQRVRDFAPRMAEVIREVELDGIVAVPLHPSHTASRGYNQALLLAEQLGQVLALPVFSPVVRIHQRAAQAELPHEARAANIAGVFRARIPGMKRRILLVDDVFTTGATLRELQKTLTKQHWQCMAAITIARG